MKLTTLKRPPESHRMPPGCHSGLMHSEQGTRIHRVVNKLSTPPPVVRECTSDDAGHLLLELLTDELLDDGFEV